MNRLKTYDKDNMSKKIKVQLKEYLIYNKYIFQFFQFFNRKVNREEFDIEKIKSAVPYVADIAKFCKAMDIFADVNEKVKPKIDEVNKLNAELSKAMSELAVKEANLKKVEDQLENLITTYKEQQSELTGLEEKKKRTKI